MSASPCSPAGSRRPRPEPAWRCIPVRLARPGCAALAHRRRKHPPAGGCFPIPSMETGRYSACWPAMRTRC